MPEFLTFAFVNPSLVYPRRGTVVAAPGLHARGLLRAASGALSIAVAQLTPVGVVFAREWSEGPAVGAATSVLMLIQFYLAHTGLAAMQLGLCRQLGLEVPERYVQPLRAASPSDFWRRWNTYVGSWVRIHLFRPLALYGAKKWGFRGQLWLAAVVLASFVWVGALHDLFASLEQRDLHFRWVAWFALNGLVVVGWEALARARKRGTGTRGSVYAAHALVVTIAVFMAGHVR